jgi:hypothetical protein
MLENYNAAFADFLVVERARHDQAQLRRAGSSRHTSGAARLAAGFTEPRLVPDK